MKTHLANEAWLKMRATQDVMRALAADGAQARFVGGVVRDSLLSSADDAEEIDIAINRKPQEVSALLEKAGIKPIPIGADHGTIACVIEKQRYEITSLRLDVATDGRHAEVAFTENWIADAKRRDFTINAIYANAAGEIYDPIDGRADLARMRIRFIGDASTRIREDYLRILRYFRFFARFGGEADRAAIQCCAEEKAGLARLSAERMRGEMFKLLPASYAPDALRLMAAAGILPLILPRAAQIDFFARMHHLMKENFIEGEALRLFAALYGDFDAAAADGRRLKLAGGEIARVGKMLAQDEAALKSYLSIRETRKLLYRWGVEKFSDRVWRAWAADENARNAIGWRALLALAESWERPDFPLTGEMVKAAGVPEGEEVGRVMREVEEWWVDAEFIEDEFSIIERLKAVVQATIYQER